MDLSSTLTEPNTSLDWEDTTYSLTWRGWLATRVGIVFANHLLNAVQVLAAQLEQAARILASFFAAPPPVRGIVEIPSEMK